MANFKNYDDLFWLQRLFILIVVCFVLLIVSLIFADAFADTFAKIKCDDLRQHSCDYVACLKYNGPFTYESQQQDCEVSLLQNLLRNQKDERIGG